MRKTTHTLLAIAAANLTTASGALAEVHEVAFHGATLVYSDTGPNDAESTPLVLVHGWASAHTFWHKQIDVFSEDRRVIAINLPGNGASEDVEADHTMDLYADAIAAAMDDAGVEEAVLIGHSNGVPTIRQFYRNYPDRVVAFVSVDGALKNVFPAEMAAPVLEQLDGPNAKEFAVNMFQAMTSVLKHPEDADLIMETLSNTGQHALAGGMRAGIDPAIWIDDTIDRPVLVINAQSPFWTEEYLAAVGELSEDVSIETWEGVSHFLFMDDPERFNATVMAWLNDRDL